MCWRWVAGNDPSEIEEIEDDAESVDEGSVSWCPTWSPESGVAAVNFVLNVGNRTMVVRACT